MLRKRSKRNSRRAYHVEPLEPRRLLAADPVISEFMPDNDEFLFDEDGSSPDWIEISNQGDEAIDLDGWFLTDEFDNLDKWRFPSTTLNAGQSIVVFASGKDRSVSGSELHTDFQLQSAGESVMLVRPDGTPASQFFEYPMVPENVSYGEGLVVLNQTLLDDGAAATLLVPSTSNGGDQLGTTWTQAAFDDSSWTAAETSIGFGGGDLVIPAELHWPLDDTGVLVLDASDNGNNALRLPGNASSSTDVAPIPTGSARSLSFDGSNDAIVANAYEGILGSDTRSVSAWINTTKDPATDTYAPSLVHWGGAGNGERFTFGLNENPSNGTVGALRVEVAGGFVVANTNLTDGQWHHVAVAFDSADGGGVNSVTLFVDGADDGSSGQGSDVAINTVAGDRVTLGAGPGGGLNRNYEGLMDDVRIYDSALSMDDITALFSGSGPSTGIATDVSGPMLDNNASVFVRVPFDVTDIEEVNELTLDMSFDDGFIAYVNGQEVARNNAPNGAAWNATATDEHDRDDIVSTAIPVTGGFLQNGENILAIQGLNVSAGDNDFLVAPTLTGTGVTTSSRTGYFAMPTPGTRNGEVDLQSGPTILAVDHSPAEPTDSDDIVVTVLHNKFAPTVEVMLHYRVGYGDETVMAMLDNGGGADVLFGDGIFTAVIDDSVAGPGEMVRWYVTSTRLDDGVVSRSPLWDASVVEQDNAPEYYGTMVADPAVDSDLPVFYWFLEPGSESRVRHLTSGTRTSVFYAGEFYDNAFVRVRGGSTSGLAKNSFKIDFNRGNHFRFDPNLPRVSEINLNTTVTDKAYVRQSLTFDTYDAVGAPGSISFPLRLQRNGEFFSVAVFIEQPDEDLLAREGLDPEGALYKMFNTFTSSTNVEKKTRQDEGNADLADFISRLNGSSGDDLRNYIFDHVDVPGMVSYLAGTVLTQNDDQQAKNYYLYRDSNGSGEWFMLPWDLDLTFGLHFMTNDSVRDDEIWADEDNILGGNGNNVPISPSHPYVGEQEHPGNRSWNRMIDKLYELPEFREMFLRRLRTTMDELLGAPGSPEADRWMDNRVDEMVAQIGNDATLDFAAWADPWNYGLNLSIDEAVDRLKTLYLDVRRTHLFETHNVDNLGEPDIVGIPHAQVPNPRIDFGQTDHSPASGNQDEEFIELVNPNSDAVDISGWRLMGGVEHTFKPGTVIRAGDSIYISPDVTAFRARMSGPSGGQGLFVQGDYQGHLSRFGETVELVTSDGTIMGSFTTPDAPSDVQRFLRVSEIHFNPADGDEKEFLEVTNTSSGGDATTLDLSGANVSQGFSEPFVFAAGTTLAPGEYLVVVRDLAAFSTAYPNVPAARIAGQYVGALANGGERVKLDDADNNTVIDFTYDDADPWFERADGAGASLEAVLDAATEDTTFQKYYHWRSSTEIGGTPGSASSPDVGVVINEVLTNSLLTVDAIELLNTTSEDIDVSGWFLSDSTDNLKKYEIPAGTVLAAGELIVFDETHFNSLAEPNPFALSGNGDDVYLTTLDNRIADDVHFGAAAEDGTLIRVPNGTGRLALSSQPTLGCNNGLQHLSELVISEIQYAPTEPSAAALLIDPNLQASDLEFVEIYNASTVTVNLGQWRLRGGVDFEFDFGQTLAVGENLLVIPFNPNNDANTVRVAAFRAHYGIDESVTLIGGYGDQLSNSGEPVQLQAPFGVGEDRVIVTVDEVLYDDQVPWPTGADGTGDSLSRIAPIFLGNLSNTWSASTPSPGTVRTAPAFTGDMDGDGVVDASDITALFVATNNGVNISFLDNNGDSLVDSVDFAEIIAGLGILPGDANLDGVVDAADLNVVGLNWQSATCNTWATGDFTGDGAVDAADLNVIGLNWQQRVANAARTPRAALGMVEASPDVVESIKVPSKQHRSTLARRRLSSMSTDSYERRSEQLADRVLARWHR